MWVHNNEEQWSRTEGRRKACESKVKAVIRQHCESKVKGQRKAWESKVKAAIRCGMTGVGISMCVGAK